MQRKKFSRSKRKQSISLEKISKNQQVVIASHNPGKVNEFKSLFSKYDIRILTSSDINISDVEEVGRSFRKNALIKVQSIPNDFIGISDDSGLCVKSLAGKPGIYSARFSKKCGGWYKAMEKIYEEIKIQKRPDFSAKFFCVIAIKFKNGKIYTYSGEVKGTLKWPPSGKNGFGYDPFFIPKNFNHTFGEMQHSTKIFNDHRYVAFRKLIKAHLPCS